MQRRVEKQRGRVASAAHLQAAWRNIQVRCHSALFSPLDRACCTLHDACSRPDRCTRCGAGASCTLRQRRRVLSGCRAASASCRCAVASLRRSQAANRHPFHPSTARGHSLHSSDQTFRWLRRCCFAKPAGLGVHDDMLELFLQNNLLRSLEFERQPKVRR